MPADVQGNMTAVSAEGNGDRFVVIALETPHLFDQFGLVEPPGPPRVWRDGQDRRGYG